MRFCPRFKGKDLVYFVLRWVAIGGVVLMSLFCMTRMPGKSYSGPTLPPSEDEAAISVRLRQHVTALADTVGERSIWRPTALQAASVYIEERFTATGLECRSQSYECRGVSVRNLVAEVRGSEAPEEITLIGAHYDSIMGSPGANDNASGVAVLLELARFFASREVPRTLRFVAFVNEEPPFFQTHEMGSVVYARAARERGDRITGMLALETMGCYADAPGTQRYPFPFSAFYPHTGDFIAFIGNLSSCQLVRRCTGAFREHTSFPSEGAAVPGWITGAGWSDHWAFWKEGYRAVMVTDTAPFRYAHYHSVGDTPDRIDYMRLARVTRGLTYVINDLLSEGK